jgi:[protein-PII] uridylyltransferase
MTPRLSSLDREPALANLVASVHAALPLPELRRLLHEAGASFDLRYRGGEPVRLLVSERAAFMDLIVDAVWRRFPWDDRVALLAVGGYGRGELHPHSDIDVLILTSRRSPQRYAENVSAFIAALWDLQLKVGHSVRTLGECKAAARADITVATNLMETRTIAGNARIEREMQERTSPSRIWPSA